MNKRPSFFRRQLLIDKTIQMPLLFYYFGATVIGVLAFAASSLAVTMFVSFDVDQSWGTLFLAFTLFISFTIFIYIGLYLTNKVAGPIYRLRLHLKDIADGKAPTKMVARNDDFTAGLVSEYNRMVEKLSNQQTSDEKAKQVP